MNEDARNEAEVMEEVIEVGEKPHGSLRGKAIAFVAGAAAFGVGMLIAKCRSKKEEDFLEEEVDFDDCFFEDEGALEEVLEAGEKESEN